MQYGYRIVEDMISGLSHYMEDNGIEKLSDLVGLPFLILFLPKILIEVSNCFLNLMKMLVLDVVDAMYHALMVGHQAIDWDEEARRPRLNTDKCVGCHLCLNVCPVMDCITPGEIVINLDVKNTKSKSKLSTNKKYHIDKEVLVI